MVAVRSEPLPSVEDPRLLLTGVSWAEYCRLREIFEHRPSVRLTYLRGALELMTTGGVHELSKKRIARLVEAWSEERGIDLRGWGSTTFRSEAKERGLEPDECYVLGERPTVDAPQVIDRPDIALEIVISSPLLDKLEVYAGLDVPEVWIFRDGAFRIFVLDREKYREEPRSALLPALDFALIAALAKEPKQIDAVRALRARLAAG